MSPDPSFVPYRPGILAEDGTPVGTHDPRLVRTNYFDGQLLKASDLTRDQTYLDERLLEVGQILGSGIAQGLETRLLPDLQIEVQPGMAVAPSGRVLQLEGSPLVVDLLDIASIVNLNQGQIRRLQRGLYVVALQYADVIADVAESYPTLDGRRRGHVGLWAEGVELTLISLPLDLPEGDGLALRAGLERRLQGTAFTLPGDESVALGLLAVDRTGAPTWLDRGLVRRPLRPAHTPYTLQDDLRRHHEELFEAVRLRRAELGWSPTFAAHQHFELLPPSGPVPKACFDPVEARQVYFPEAYDVAVAPVRRCDLPSLLEEARTLAPIDLARDQDVDILVLVPMDDKTFAMRARQLELRTRDLQPTLGSQFAPRILNCLDALTLRVIPAPKPHKEPGDVEVWRDIWSAAPEKELVYVRRPPRAAETQVSGIVLAQGFEPEKWAVTDLEKVEKERDAAIARAQKAETDLDIARKAKDALQVDLEVAKAQLAKAQTDLAAAQGLVATLQADLKTAKEARAKAEADLKVAVDARTKAETELKAALEAKAKLEGELKTAAAVRAELQAEIERLKAQIEQGSMSLRQVSILRGVPADEALKLDDHLRKEPKWLQAALTFVILAPAGSDKLLWRTLMIVAEKPDRLPEVSQRLVEGIQAGASFARILLKLGPDLGLDPALLEAWTKFDR